MKRMFLGALVVLLALGACGSPDAQSSEPTAAASSPSPPPVATGTVEQLAARLGCQPQIRTEAAELRQGVCRAATGEFTVTTFPQERFKLTWLDAAAGWGGWYVVGPLWAVSASTKAIADDFRQTLGGSLIDGSKIPKPVGPGQ
ncbi:hypothetical protein [Cryptosporangium aurantiacum]|nr:hypothetical protein [Cryptosporangium aurantiacum]